MGGAALRVDGLGKLYRIGERDPTYTLRDLAGRVLTAPLSWWVGSNATRPPSELWALRDVSFDVQPGEVVGIIGRNGAGKSTLLKILSRIIEPTQGRAVLDGRVGSLLEVGTGFHPELTGRENVYFNGAVLGMRKVEIDRKFDEIVAFSEIEQFIDTPVKRYSSGMQMRLAFAVAAHLEPEILLVDEVLAVGDLEFQRKCLGKLGAVAHDGRTVLFVAHNLGAISRLCPRSILIDHGQLLLDGPSDAVIRRYQSLGAGGTGAWSRSEPALEGAELVLRSVTLRNCEGRAEALFDGNETIGVEIGYSVGRPLASCQIAVRLYNADNLAVLTSSDADAAGVAALPRSVGAYRTTFRIPGQFLAPGLYHLAVVAQRPNRAIYDLVDDAVTFEVSLSGSLSTLDGRGGVLAPLLWSETTEVESDA